VPSLLAVAKWRAGGWWEQTLRPLRSREVAARLPASGAGGAEPSGCGDSGGTQPGGGQLLAGMRV